MAQMAADVALWVFFACMIWLVATGYGMRLPFVRNTTRVTRSWTRVVPPALLGGIAVATHMTLSQASLGSSSGALLTWMAIAALFGGGSLLSGVLMMLVRRRYDNKRASRERAPV